eukprot:1369730-Amorphochlora_amoeboformis.AAC.1
MSSIYHPISPPRAPNKFTPSGLWHRHKGIQGEGRELRNIFGMGSGLVTSQTRKTFRFRNPTMEERSEEDKHRQIAKLREEAEDARM